MRYASVCSGIEAASVAWHPLGWDAAFFAEIDRFPSAVLAHHHPGIPNLGDITRFKDWPDAAFDVLIGGTPCQSFSVAGLRKGLADPRGNLALVYLAIADRFRPRWVVWENVPGVLSSNGGRDFGAFLGGLGQLGYGWAYRVLDAQYVRVDGLARAIPQRRRRVFVVGHLGDWRRAAAALFERESLFWDHPPRREAGKDIAGPLGGSAQSGGFRTTDLDNQGAYIPEIVPQAMSHKWHKGSSGPAGDEVANLVAFSCKDHGADVGDTAPTLRAMGHDGSHANAGGQVAVAFAQNSRDELVESEIMQSLKAGGGKPGQSYPAIRQGWAVRRLTPMECERLQGFPDGYTAIPYREKIAADGPRYKALGNSMAVNVVRWIGKRIDLVESTASPASQTHSASA